MAHHLSCVYRENSASEPERVKGEKNYEKIGG